MPGTNHGSNPVGADTTHPRLDRRAFLATGAVGLTTALAGCSSGGGTTQTEAGLTLESVDVNGSPGGPVSLRPPGKVVLLDFFATWCAPCKPEMANLRTARSRFDREQVFIVSITQETDVQAIKQFWKRYEGTWPVVMDADLEATRKYGVSGIPTIIVLTPDGEEVMRHTGLAGETRILENVQQALRKSGMGRDGTA